MQAIKALTAPGGEYELVERKVRGGNLCRVVKNAPNSVVDLLVNAGAFGGLEYLSYREETYTFADVIDQTARLAEVLKRLGVRRGDRVAVCMRNYPEWPAAFFAPITLGAVTVSLNAWWGGEEIEYGLRDAGARALIVDGGRLGRIRDRLPKLGIQAVAVRSRQAPAEGIIAWQDALHSASGGDLRPAPGEPDDDCLMLYTSGSTAGPKGAVSTHSNVVHALLAWEIENRAQAALRNESVQREPFDIQCRMLVTIPFFHVTACHACMLGGLRLGRRLTLMHKWDVEKALDTIERDRITHFISVPTITGDLTRAAAARKRALPSLLAIGGGGSHRPATQVLAIRETFENAMPGTGWGMTETNAIGTQIGSPDYLNVPASSGRCSVLMDIKIVDPASGSELRRGEVGELWVKGTPVVREYWNKPAATAQAFKDGWFRTGDLAYVDDQEFFYFVDRVKDIVIRGGENISCLQVEDALYRCDGVAEAVAFGMPDERLGEKLTAVVVPRSGSCLTVEGIRNSMEEHLGRFQVPEQIVIREKPLPRIATGKFAKRSIRQALVQEGGKLR